ncbi:DUF3667 domain-containing protein [Hymenobacter sediminis]|uniref:DUF3667 domain-containing protein n=1 Tax=Hymenobacter sediminis TaxID=2218621 RepID=UPI000DA6C326|nr:DUF3667 domain-containing protein [Hymenobacter sediminis]RPD44339.1 DUF3667 domain-containing protein [Hymenobacter sediminis]
MESVVAVPAADAPHAVTQDVDCLNCGHVMAQGLYCSHCGQQRPHRLSVGHVLHELLHIFTHTDKSIFAYIGQVLLYPGQVVADYLAGRRKRYFNPFQFLLLAVGAATLLTTVGHYYEATGHSLQQRLQSSVTAAQLVRVESYFHFVGKYQNLWWLLLLLPIYSLIAWGMYGRRRVNYAEAFLVFVVVGAAFHIFWVVVLLGLVLFMGPFSGTSNLAALLQVIVMFSYLTLIGRRALGLSTAGSLWRAAVIVLLGAACGAGINYVAFRLYVMGG